MQKIQTFVNFLLLKTEKITKNLEIFIIYFEVPIPIIRIFQGLDQV